MGTKLTAADMVATAGEVTIVANARAKDILPRVLAGEQIGTLVVPTPKRMSARRRWIGQASRAAGRVVVDDGAAAALRSAARVSCPAASRA